MIDAAYLMTSTYIVALAESLYDERVGGRGPAWNQLGEITQSVWIERARVEMELVFGLPVCVVDKPASAAAYFIVTAKA